MRLKEGKGEGKQCNYVLILNVLKGKVTILKRAYRDDSLGQDAELETGHARP